MRRSEDRMQDRDLARRLSLRDQLSGNLGRVNLRRRDDVYSCDELVRQIQRERHGGYPCSSRNCLCDGDCDDGHGRRRSKYVLQVVSSSACLAANGPTLTRSKQRHGSEQKKFSLIGPVYLNGCESDTPYVSYNDWPPVDIYKRRWCGLLPDKRLPWLTEDTLLDGNDIVKFPKRRRRRYSGYPCH